jgi:hypothetical protein
MEMIQAAIIQFKAAIVRPQPVVHNNLWEYHNEIGFIATIKSETWNIKRTFHSERLNELPIEVIKASHCHFKY